MNNDTSNKKIMYDPDLECSKLANRIRNICNERCLTLHSVAVNAQISPSSLSELVNGNSKPQIYTLYKICNALEISIAELFSGIKLNEDEEWCENLSDVREDCLRIIGHLPDWKIELLHEYLRMLSMYDKQI